MTSVLIPTALAAGFFGSTHCIAMCGAIVLLFENQKSQQEGRLLRRLSYNTGRMLFYVALGLIAGASGALLMSGLTQGLVVLRFIAAVLIILLGINLALEWQALRFLEVAGASIWKRLSPLARHVLPVRSLAGALGAGFLWGALPCGLVYSTVALASTGGSAASGAMVMFAFWLGTLPSLLLAGASAERLHRWKSRVVFRQIAGVLMIVAGLVALSLPLIHFGGREHQGHGHSSIVESAITQQIRASMTD